MRIGINVKYNKTKKTLKVICIPIKCSYQNFFLPFDVYVMMCNGNGIVCYRV